MDKPFRDRLAAATAIVALTLGAGALVNHRVDLGVQFTYDGTLVRIASVAERSPAAAEGFEAGMIVLGLNDVQLVWMPQYVYAECITEECQANPPEPVIEPSVPTPAQLDVGTLSALLAAPVRQLQAIRPADYAVASPESRAQLDLRRPGLPQ